MGAELSQELLLGLDVADQNREVELQSIALLLDDAVQSPLKRANQDQGKGKDAEEGEIQPARRTGDPGKRSIGLSHGRFLPMLRICRLPLAGEQFAEAVRGDGG